MESKGRIGLIMPHILNNIDISFVDIISTTAAKYGYDTILISGVINYKTEMLEDDYCKGLINIYNLIEFGDFDGFLMAANSFCSDKLRNDIIDMLHKKNKPCTVVEYEQSHMTNISVDETEALKLSTEHLIKKHGCRSLFCIGGYENDAKSLERISGFTKAMDEAGLEYDEGCIFYGDYWRDKPRKIGTDIADGTLPKPDGIVCASDFMAIELCRSFREHGIRVPDDIKLTGCDGNEMTQTEYVSITTIANMEKQRGFLAIKKLLELLGHDDLEDLHIPLSLIIGESCGCADCGNLKRSRELSELRSYAGSILEKNQNRRFINHNGIIKKMTECSKIYEAMGAIASCCYIIPGFTGVEICLCNDWCRDFHKPSLFRRTGLPDKMILGMEISEKGYGRNMYEFPASDILPSLTKPHEPRLTVISSLHYKGQIFGYVCFTYQKAADIVFDEFFMNWCDSISSSLNIIQNKMYNEYVNRRIESISEYAPALGIYNKRGLIRKLSDMTAENNDKKLFLITLTYVEDDKLKYTVPPLNAIVNALRIKKSDEALLACIDEDVIAIIIDSSQKEKTSYEISEYISLQVSETYKESVEINENNIIIMTSTIDSMDIFSVDKLIEKMANKTKGKAISIKSGIYNYKDSFYTLRNDIFKQPQNEWSIETITKNLNISKSHFQRIYKELFGTNCKEDIITARLTRAKWLLSNTDMPVVEISEQCGYLNISHFVRQFRSKTNMTASEYRNNFAKKV